MERKNTIDIAKGFGIFLVIWGHTVCPIKPYFYLFHVPVFFLLSGYVFNGNDSIEETFIKKIRSLVIPFIFFLILQRIGFVIIHLLDGSFSLNYLLLWKPVYPGLTIGPLWFFLALFITTIIYSIINKLPNDFYKTGISFFLAFLGYLFFVYKIHLPFHIDSSLSMIIFFHLGKEISKLKTKRIAFKYWLLMAISSIIFFIIFINRYLPTIDVPLNIINGPYLPTLGEMFLGCFMLLLISKVTDYIPRVRTAISYIGRNSLTVFAIHIVFIYFVYLVFPKNTVSVFGGMCIALFALVISLIINILLQKHFPLLVGKKKI
ncbi:MAG: acyltransferase family protein [Bacteroidales bacterium]|nr:acyltransferase family protein [Bacteroidales bacterium]